MRHAATVLVSLAGAVTLAACSSSTGGSGGALLGMRSDAATTVSAAPGSTHAPGVTHAPSAFPSRSTSSTQPTPAATSPASGPASPSHVTNELDALLLTGSDVGAGFKAQPESPPSPLPCTPDRPPVDGQLDHVEKSSTVLFNASEGTQVGEEVYVYGSATEAVRHQQISEAGLACAKGIIGGGEIDIAGPTDVTKELYTNTTKAEAWSLANRQIGASLVLVRINAVVVQFSFVADAGIHPKVSAQKVIDRALAKIVSGK